MKVWILTRAINQYDQEGDYFISWFINKPTFEEFQKVIESECTLVFYNHVMNGGGRISDEYEWYYLKEMNSGEIYEP